MDPTPTPTTDPPPTPPATAPPAGRTLGLATAAALVVGEVLGVGIFLTPAGMAKSLGSPALLLLAWLAMGGVALCGALAFGELAARVPEAGGGYAYLRAAFGPGTAFLYGWTSLLVLDPGITAALAAGLSTYAGELLPLGPAGLKLVGVAAILALAGANAAGVRFGARVLGGLAALKLGLLAMLVLWAFAPGRGDWANLLPFVERRAGSPPPGPALVGAAIGAFFAFGGWWDAAKVGGELRDPGRTLPRALALGVSSVAVVYVFVSLAFLRLVPLELVEGDRGFAAQAGAALFGPAGGSAFAAVVVVSVLGSLAAILMAAPRVYVAMARDGLFPPALAVLGRRSGAPARAIAVQAALASALVLTGSFDQILAYFIAVAVAFLAATVAGLYVLRRRPGPGPAFRTPGYPLTPLGFLLPASALVVLLAMDHPGRALFGLGVVLLGLPAYRLARQLDARRAAADA